MTTPSLSERELIDALARVLYRHDYPANEYGPLSKSPTALEYDREARVAWKAVQQDRKRAQAMTTGSGTR